MFLNLSQNAFLITLIRLVFRLQIIKITNNQVVLIIEKPQKFCLRHEKKNPTFENHI
jgi:hypothetical protein